MDELERQSQSDYESLSEVELAREIRNLLGPVDFFFDMRRTKEMRMKPIKDVEPEMSTRLNNAMSATVVLYSHLRDKERNEDDS